MFSIMGIMGADDLNTYQKFIKPFVEALSSLEPVVVSQNLFSFPVILLNHSKKIYRSQQQLMSVDGISFQIPEIGLEYLSPKFAMK